MVAFRFSGLEAIPDSERALRGFGHSVGSCYTIAKEDLSLNFPARHLASVALLLTISALALQAQSLDSLEIRVLRIMARPEFAHSNFGVEFYDLDTGKVI